MKKDLPMLAILAALTSISNNGRPYEVPDHRSVTKVPKGHSLFFVDGVSVYALNLKNARKKVAKIKSDAEPL